MLLLIACNPTPALSTPTPAAVSPTRPPATPTPSQTPTRPTRRATPRPTLTPTPRPPDWNDPAVRQAHIPYREIAAGPNYRLWQITDNPGQDPLRAGTLRGEWLPDGRHLDIPFVLDAEQLGHGELPVALVVLNLDARTSWFLGYRDVFIGDWPWYSYSADGSRIAYRSDGRFRIVDPENHLIQELLLPEHLGLHDPVLSPDGKLMCANGAVSPKQSLVAVLDLQGNLLHEWRAEQGRYCGPAVWSGDGRRVAFMQDDNGPVSLCVADLTTDDLQCLPAYYLPPSEMEPYPPDWMGQDRFILITAPPRSEQAYIARLVGETWTIEEVQAPARSTGATLRPEELRKSYDISGSGHYLAACRGGGTAFYDLQKDIRFVIEQDVPCRSPIWSPDERWAILLGEAGQSRLVDLPAGTATPWPLPEAITDGAWSPDGSMIVYAQTAGSDLQLLLQHWPQGEIEPVGPTLPEGSACWRYHPDLGWSPNGVWLKLWICTEGRLEIYLLELWYNSQENSY